jgi:hypothetical protein
MPLGVRLLPAYPLPAADEAVGEVLRAVHLAQITRRRPFRSRGLRTSLSLVPADAAAFVRRRECLPRDQGGQDDRNDARRRAAERPVGYRQEPGHVETSLGFAASMTLVDYQGE